MKQCLACMWLRGDKRGKTPNLSLSKNAIVQIWLLWLMLVPVLLLGCRKTAWIHPLSPEDMKTYCMALSTVNILAYLRVCLMGTQA